ncbi:MAG: hypothetical protein ACRD3Q_08745, partial [Terriglobales bacterium]
VHKWFNFEPTGKGKTAVAYADSLAASGLRADTAARITVRSSQKALTADRGTTANAEEARKLLVTAYGLFLKLLTLQDLYWHSQVKLAACHGVYSCTQPILNRQPGPDDGYPIVQRYRYLRGRADRLLKPEQPH